MFQRPINIPVHFKKEQPVNDYAFLKFKFKINFSFLNYLTFLMNAVFIRILLIFNINTLLNN